jgi:hypothetical protein
MAGKYHRVMIVDRLFEDVTGIWCDGLVCLHDCWFPQVATIPSFGKRSEVHTGYTIEIVRDSNGVWVFNRVLKRI